MNNYNYLPQGEAHKQTPLINGVEDVASTEDSQSWHYDLPARIQLHIEIIVERLVGVLGGEWSHQIRKPTLILVAFCVLATLRTARRSNKNMLGYYHSDPYGSYRSSSLRGTSIKGMNNAGSGGTWNLSKPSTTTAYGGYSASGSAYGTGGSGYSTNNAYSSGNSYNSGYNYGGGVNRNMNGVGNDYSNSAGVGYGTGSNGAYGSDGYGGLPQQQQYNSGYGSGAQTGYGAPVATTPLASSYGDSTTAFGAGTGNNSYGAGLGTNSFGATTQAGYGSGAQTEYGRSTQVGYGNQQQYGTTPLASSQTASSYGASASNLGTGTTNSMYGANSGTSASLGSYSSNTNLYGSATGTSSTGNYDSLTSSSSYTSNSKSGFQKKKSILERLWLRIKSIFSSFLFRKKKSPYSYQTSSLYSTTSSSSNNLGY